MHRLLASLLILILVSGCDVAMSEKPIFTGADTAGAPQFENGVWLLEDDSDCHVDPAQPASRWPECANWIVFRDGQLFERVREGDIAVKRIENAVLIVSGDVGLAQIEYRSSGGLAVEPPVYFFAAFENIDKPPTLPLRSIALWSVMCGTRPGEPGKAASDDHPGELVRFPGFDEKCQPGSQDALRAAALASRPSGEPRLRAIWMRATLD